MRGQVRYPTRYLATVKSRWPPRPTRDTHAPMPTFSLTLDAARERAEDLSAELFDEGASGVEVRDGEGTPMPGVAQPARGPRAARGVLRRARAPPRRRAPRTAASSPRLPTRTGARAWKKGLGPLEVGRAFVRPSWVDAPVPPGMAEIVLDPGMAFGTGNHPTTSLCLARALGRCSTRARARPCSTSAPARASSRSRPRSSGAGRVAANDNDPVAVEVARENAERNGAALELTGAPVGAIARRVRPRRREHPREHARRARAGRSPRAWRRGAPCSSPGSSCRRRTRSGPRTSPRGSARPRSGVTESGACSRWSARARDAPPRPPAARSVRGGARRAHARGAPLPARRPAARPGRRGRGLRRPRRRVRRRIDAAFEALSSAPARGRRRRGAAPRSGSSPRSRRARRWTSSSRRRRSSAPRGSRRSRRSGRWSGSSRSKGEERARRWRRIAEEAARQCGRADVPLGRARRRARRPRLGRCRPARSRSRSTRAARLCSPLEPVASLRVRRDRRARGRAHGGGARGLRRGGRAARRRSGHASCAPRPPRSSRSRCSRRASAIGALPARADPCAAHADFDAPVP